MSQLRSSLFAWICGAAAVVASLSFERSALADEEVGPAPSPPPPAPVVEGPAPAPAAGPAPAMAPAATPALAGAPADRDVAEERETVVLKPWDVDVRASLHTTPILQYGGVGASADAGMRRLGPGTLALGGGLDYFFCGTTCSSTPLAFTQRQLAVEARLSYHLEPPKIGRVDLYPLLTAGFMVSRSSITVGDNSEYRASDVAPTIGFGAGASYFFTDRFFVAAEARFRYAAGTYAYELASGPAREFDRSGIDTWSASTVDLAAAVGARF
ncbi:MAG: hypothetical protein JWP87_392 [Labilithrix sp.]|nr:hypothetical protein [Labilithrix sp.]